MPTTRTGRLLFLLIVFSCLFVIGRNLYRRSLNERLYAAVQHSDLAAVRDLVARHADVNYIHPREDDFKMPSRTQEAFFEQSVMRAAIGRLSSPQPEPPTPKDQAAEAIVCLLIRNGVNLGAHGERGAGYLWEACSLGRIAIVQCLLDRGADPNKRHEPFGTAVDGAIGYTTAQQQSNAQEKKACLSRTRQMMQLLRERGARITTAQAVQVEDSALLKSVLDAGESASQKRQMSEQPALCLAAEKQNIEAVKMLLAHGADVNAHTLWKDSTNHDYIGETALCTAARNGNTQLVKLLLAHGANVNFQANYTTPLLNAANGKHLDIFRLLLAHGADPKLTPVNNVGSSVLAAAIRNLPEVVPELLQRGADPKGINGDTLQAAVYAHRLDLVQEFVRRGVPVNPPFTSNVPYYVQAYYYKPGKYRITAFSPLGIAICQAPECESLLLRAGAKLGPDAPSILAAVARVGRVGIFARLLTLGADPNGIDSDGETPLTQAVQHTPGGVETLLKGGANPNYVTRNQRTPLSIAAGTGDAKTVSLLLAHGANVNAHPRRAHTALYYARKRRNAAVTALLEKAGATDDR